MIRNAWSFSPERRKAAFRSGRFEMDTNSPQSAGLVGWWPLGVHSGNANDRDYSGFKNHGVRTNGPTPKAVNHSRWGGVMALDFDGSDDYVDIGTHTLGTTFSFSAWVFVDTGTAFPSNAMMVSDSSLDIFFDLATGKLQMRMRTDTITVDAGDEISKGEWHHLVATGDGTTIKLYIDSVNKKEGSGTDSMGTEQLFIGSSSTGFFWIGKLDDLRIHNRDLSASMINQTHNEPWRLVYPLGVRTVSFAPVAAPPTDGVARLIFLTGEAA